MINHNKNHNLLSTFFAACFNILVARLLSAYSAYDKYPSSSSSSSSNILSTVSAIKKDVLGFIHTLMLSFKQLENLTYTRGD